MLLLAGVSGTFAQQPPVITEARFATLFPDFAVRSESRFFLGPANSAEDSCAAYDGVARIQSAAFAGAGSAEGLFAYVYQVECVNGQELETPDFEIPLAPGTVLDSILFDAPFVRVPSSDLEDECAAEPAPFGAPFDDPRGGFNQSQLGMHGGAPGDDILGAVLVDDTVQVRMRQVSWSSPLLVFVTDRCPQVGTLTMTGPLAPGETARLGDAITPGGPAPCAAAPENCSDGVDNDRNGVTDCADRSCQGTFECPLSVCGDELVAPTEVCDPPGASGECSAGRVCSADCLACVSGPSDLRVRGLDDPPASAAFGAVFTVRDSVLNAGATAAAPSTTAYRLTLDATCTAADLQLTGTASIPGLPIGASFTQSAEVTLLDSMAPGTYLLCSCADADGALVEGNELNNCRVSVGKIAIGPDLVVTSVSQPPSVVPAGGTFSLTDITKNAGTERADASETRYHLAGAPGVFLTPTRAVGSLAPGVSVRGTIDVTVPAHARAGNYTLHACADGGSSVPEANETNNCRVASGTVQVTKPELLVTTLSEPPSSIDAGESFDVTDTTRNSGTGSAPAFVTGHVLASDRRCSLPRALGEREIGGLGADSPSTGMITVTVPRTTPAGSYFLCACADRRGAVTEDDEGNNCRASENDVVVTRRPDLEVTALSSPTSVPRGSGFTVRDTTANSGVVTAIESMTGYRLSRTDNICTRNRDPLLGSRPVEELSPNERDTTRGVRLQIPETAEPGTYFLCACADDPRLVEEASETNNCLASAQPIEVTDAPADLFVSEVMEPPPVVEAGSGFEARETVRNEGPGLAGESVTIYRLSGDRDCNPVDPSINGTRSVRRMLAEETSRGPADVTIPASFRAGAYHLCACADGTGRVVESNESNNCLSSEGTVSVTALPTTTSSSATTSTTSSTTSSSSTTTTVSSTTAPSATVTSSTTSSSVSTAPTTTTIGVSTTTTSTSSTSSTLRTGTTSTTTTSSSTTSTTAGSTTSTTSSSSTITTSSSTATSTSSTTTTTREPPCRDDGQCEDRNQCTTDTCTNGRCTSTPLEGVGGTACQVGRYLRTDVCGADAIPAPLRAAIEQRGEKARRLLDDAAGAVKRKRARQLVQAAEQQLRRLQRKVRRSARRGLIEEPCRRALDELIAALRQAISGVQV